MLLLTAFLAAVATATCPCGYKDPSTDLVFTESILIYFNETNAIDSSVLTTSDYQRYNQKGWQVIYPQGASPDNVDINNTSPLPWTSSTGSSLEMFLDGARFDHHSVGAELQTVRQDILYGTFRASMRSAQPWIGGSAMSMYLKYNDSNSLEIDMLNMDNPNQARITQLINGEVPSDDRDIQYSSLQQASLDPWNFLDLRFDWTGDSVDFYIGGNKSRSISRDDRTIPSVPQPLYFSHWSTGDVNYMQGPPVDRSVANVQWVRAFFNSSLTDSDAFDQRCNATALCSTEDMTLRGSSPYPAAATVRYEEPDVYSHIRIVAGIVAAVFSSFGVASLLNAFIRRTPWHKLSSIGRRKSTPAPTITEEPGSGTQTPVPSYPGTLTPPPGYQTRAGSVVSAPSSRTPSIAQMRGKVSLNDLIAEQVPEEEIVDDEITTISSSEKLEVIVDDHGVEGILPKFPSVPHEKTALQNFRDLSTPDAMTGAALFTVHSQEAQVLSQKQVRIDYLAGLVAISCIMVTVRHFSLTFWPYVTQAYGPVQHFAADPILSDVLASYFFTPLWIGPFFVTSCRFLAQRYLSTGKLNDVANKMLLRAPRMLIPCFIFITLEYFLISLGLTSRLEWTPSVTFSTWPYVTAQENFGVFLNDMVELAYLIPNAAPEVINHYCVGVLWTVPVQLQYSFVTLLAGVMIKDIKRPWKRVLFYTVTILAGWYANSWSACHWLGLALADADITYHWIKWTQAKWYRLYPVLFLATAMVLGIPFILELNTMLSDYPFMAYENSIHPEPVTGRPIAQTVDNIYEAYPMYYQPSLALLLFSGSVQVIVELSTWIQAFLSIKVITFFHPHIMTLYLLHGFIFWSLGAYVIVALSDTSVPYWGSLIITAVCCYTVILLLTVIITPLTDFATKGSTKNIWRWATEVPVPHRATTAPFSKALVIDREGDKAEASSSGNV